jgi:ribonuclease HII
MNSLKQSQTKPNLPAYMAGKFALSDLSAVALAEAEVEGPVYSVPSKVEGSIKTIISPYAANPICNRRFRTVWNGFSKIILQFWAILEKIISILVQFLWKGVTRMVVLAGIDEAGFGPILGPLVVSSSAFSLPQHLLTADLWQLLRKSVSETRKHLAGRLLVVDSKKAYSKQKGIGHLQRTVLACLDCLGKTPATLTELLTLLSPDCIERLRDCAWHKDIADYRLAVDVADLAIAASVLKEDLASNGIELLGLQSRCLDVAYYNRMVGNVKNKASVLFTAVSQLIKSVFDNSESENLQVIVDRQGGRTRYRRSLERMFPDMELAIIREDQTTSSYELIANGRQLRLHFVVGADRRFLPVALASMVSKYIRELLIDNMNHYFTGLIPELKPTAGYWKDGLRFIEDLKKVPYVTFDSSRLVRCR